MPTSTASPAIAPETGWPGNLRPTWDPHRGQTWAPQQPGDNPDLAFPESARVYERMRADAKVSSALRVCTQPIISADWDLTGNVRPEVEQLVRHELGLPAPGDTLPPRPRTQPGIVWSQHITEALLALVYGFMPFEQVASISNPTEAGHPAWAADRPIVHLAKLAMRLPTTLTADGVRIGRDGGLKAVVQHAPAGVAWGYINGQAGGTGDVTIPVDRLVMYTIDREGGNWYGRSLLRAAYKDWYLKDKAERVNLQALDRNGMGIPIVTYDPNSGVTRDQALEIAAEIRSGATAGAAIPPGVDVRLRGVEGQTVDALPTIKHHGQEISRSVLAMFLDLGHDNGARALGDTFVTVFTSALQAVAGQIAATATEHIVRDLVEWNFGPDEAYPRLVPGTVDLDQALTPDGLKTLAEAGVITPDAGLEDHVRGRYRLPAPTAAEPVGGPAPTPDVAASTGDWGRYNEQLARRIVQLAAHD